MRERTQQTRSTRHRSRHLAGALVFLVAALLLGRTAHAQPSLAALYGRAGAEFAAACPNFISQPCTLNACGHTVQWNNAGLTVAVPDLGIAPTQNYGQVASTINALCGASAGDGLLATGGSLSMQTAQIESVAHAQAPANRVLRTGGAYTYGGSGELGNGTYGASIPLNYSYRLGSGSTFSSVGFVSFAHQASVNQGAVSGSPAYAWQVKNEQGERIIGLAGYVPVSVAFASADGANSTLISWGAGGGALATGSTRLHAMQITYGAGGAFRWTAGGAAVPLSVLARADQPLDFLFHLFSTFASLSYGNDFVNAGSEFWSLGVGGAFQKYEFGYRGFYSGAYVAHSLGFSIRQDLSGTEIFENLPPPEEGTKPTGPTPPVGPNGPVILPAGPKFAPLPPPPEVPQLAPDCTTDLDCPGDNVCEEARCLPPL